MKVVDYILEEPDTVRVNLPNSYSIYTDYKEGVAYPFVTYKGKIIWGGRGGIHPGIQIPTEGGGFTTPDMRDYGGKYAPEGRVWLTQKVIAYWSKPTVSDLELLEKTILEDLSVSVNDTWHIDLPIDRNETAEKVAVDNGGIKDFAQYWGRPFTWYVFPYSKELPKTLGFYSERERKVVPRVEHEPEVKDLPMAHTSKEDLLGLPHTQVAYGSPEYNKKESVAEDYNAPDAMDLVNKSGKPYKRLWYTDPDAHPFAMLDGQVRWGTRGQAHGSIGVSYNGTGKEMADNYGLVNGRVWLKSKIVSFWKYPSTKEDFKFIMDEIANKFDVKIDMTWRIQLQQGESLTSISNLYRNYPTEPTSRKSVPRVAHVGPEPEPVKERFDTDPHGGYFGVTGIDSGVPFIVRDNKLYLGHKGTTHMRIATGENGVDKTYDIDFPTPGDALHGRIWWDKKVVAFWDVWGAHERTLTGNELKKVADVLGMDDSWHVAAHWDMIQQQWVDDNGDLSKHSREEINDLRSRGSLIKNDEKAKLPKLSDAVKLLNNQMGIGQRKSVPRLPHEESAMEIVDRILENFEDDHGIEGGRPLDHIRKEVERW